MTRINLLPWREELREEKKKEFFQALALVLIVAAGIVFVAGTWVDGDIEDQQARNKYIQDEITVLDQQIAEIRDLNQQRERLLSRKQVIQDLQGNRPVIVRIFDELVRTLDDGVFYTGLSVVGPNISLTGIAESNSRISALMRNIDASDWFTAPNLKGLVEATAYGPQAASFEMTIRQTLPNRADGEQ